MAAMTCTTGSIVRNRLLAALPEAERQQLLSRMQRVEFSVGDILFGEGRRPPYVYFPVTAVVSLLHSDSDGVCTEVAAVGNEGMLGVTTLLGVGESPRRALVQNSGWAYRMNGAALREEFMRGGQVQHLLLRYIQALLTMMGQVAVCNRRHSIEQQMCRWLLLNLDRTDSRELTMTHERLASLLGVRREGITEAARRLQAAGFIIYRRGHITVASRDGIEASACECYGVIRRVYEQLHIRPSCAQARPAASGGSGSSPGGGFGHALAPSPA
ncbi:MAG TPA: Crp/Fnr family transcriptional regulator [Steroidobacteraceae bacterium]|nr:Crp/Fnr family transcriptional regulator [Steroidobacteraceae bacterium]